MSDVKMMKPPRVRGVIDPQRLLCGTHLRTMPVVMVMMTAILLCNGVLLAIASPTESVDADRGSALVQIRQIIVCPPWMESQEHFASAMRLASAAEASGDVVFATRIYFFLASRDYHRVECFRAIANILRKTGDDGITADMLDAWCRKCLPGSLILPVEHH